MRYRGCVKSYSHRSTCRKIIFIYHYFYVYQYSRYSLCGSCNHTNSYRNSSIHDSLACIYDDGSCRTYSQFCRSHGWVYQRTRENSYDDYREIHGKISTYVFFSYSFSYASTVFFTCIFPIWVDYMRSIFF